MICAIYSGSFNPLHYGHTNIARYIIEKCDVDQVRFVLSPQNPLKEASTLAMADERLAKLRKALKEMGPLSEKMVVSDVEFHLKPPLYTINTLRFLSETEPENRFILIIGGDNIEIIEKWHQWEMLLQEFEIWVYPRPGYANAEALCSHYNSLPQAKGVTFLSDAPRFDISSTKIREGAL
jgi:nicotinate-nucleotide adenylyltransferase